MKTAILVLALVPAFNLCAQTVLGPRPPALSPGLIVSNQSATNIFPADLAGRLVNLQADLEQLVPLLAAFNDSFDFVSIGSGVPVAGATDGQPVVSSAAVNLGTDLSQNLSTVSSANLGVNLGANLAVPTSAQLALTPPSEVLPVTASSGAVPVTSGVGLVPSLGAPTGAVGFNSARDALRALLILEDDVERMLPIVATINQDTNNILAFQTNALTVIPPTSLTPAGR